MLNDPPKVAIVISHFANPEILIDCLKSCRTMSYPNYEIIVVYNGLQATLDMKAVTDAVGDTVKNIAIPENGGYARANNLGIREALTSRAEYILLLNDDTLISPDFLNILVGEGERSADVGVLGPRIYYAAAPDKIWFAGAEFNSQTCRILFPNADEVVERQTGEPYSSDYITGCALLIKKDVVEKIGLLNERFFLYWEDVDWGLRAQKAGYKNLIIPGAHIWHKVSVSTGGMDSPLRAYHKTRSHLLMAELHSPRAMKGLHVGFFRDIAWLLFKSSDPDKIKKARSYFAAIMDYHLGKTGGGPHWLWVHND